MLKELKCYHPNMHVVSNFLQYDSEEENALGVAWNKELIHVFNKHMVRLDDCPYKKEVSNRKNGTLHFYLLQILSTHNSVILIGDSPGDVHMSEGLDVENILKIGLLSIKPEERLAEFKEKFDIVLISDNTMDYLYSLLEQILAGVEETGSQ